MVRRWTRRGFLVAAGGAAGVAALGGWGRWVESGWLEVTHTPVRFFPARPERPLRLLHLSDLHYSSVVPLELIRNAIELGLRHHPDLAVLTGDFITGVVVPSWDDYREVLRGLTRRVAAVACLGNHDGGIDTARPQSRADHRVVRRLLQEAGVTVLYNSSLMWAQGRSLVEIIGLGDLWSRQCHPEVAFPARDQGLPRLVLCHNPDAKELMGAWRWELMLCGHSHGGQLRLPWLGSPLAPIRDKRYAAGLNPWQGRWIFTTRGVGNLHGIRIFCRPEVSLIELCGPA